MTTTAPIPVLDSPGTGVDTFGIVDANDPVSAVLGREVEFVSNTAAALGTPIDGLEDLLAVHDPTGELAMARTLHSSFETETAGSYAVSTLVRPFGESIEVALRLHARAMTVPRATKPSRAYRAFRDIARTLGFSTMETAELLGLSRGTVYAWKAGREPQPRNARRLYRLHTLLKTISRRLGQTGAQTWLNAGDPSPLDMLRQQDFAAVDQLASGLIFGDEARPSERVGALVVEDVEGGIAGDARHTEEPTPVRRLRRRAPAKRGS